MFVNENFGRTRMCLEQELLSRLVVSLWGTLCNTSILYMLILRYYMLKYDDYSPGCEAPLIYRDRCSLWRQVFGTECSFMNIFYGSVLNIAPKS